MSLSWQVNVDWTTAGTWDTRNDAERMVDYKLVRGRKQFINSNGDGLQAVEPGLLQIKLDNYDGIYDPYNTSSALYPNVEPGRFIRVKISNDENVDSIYTKVLLHCNGAGGSTSIEDASGKVWTNYVPQNSEVYIDTLSYKFGGGSLKLKDESYISTADSDDFHLGSGDWSWDLWINFSQINSTNQFYLVRQYASGNDHFFIAYYGITNNLFCEHTESGVGVWNFFCPFTPSIDTWYHIEVGRNGNTPLIFINGNLQSVTESTAISGKTAGNLSAIMQVGVQLTGGWVVHLDEIRFMKGACAHNSNFSVATSQYVGAYQDRFCGRIESIDKIGDVYNPQVLITAYDGLRELKDKKFSTAVVRGSTAARVGTQIAYMTTSAEWPAIYGTSSIDAGNGIVPYAWANEETAFQTIKDLADVEAGLFCARADGSFMFRSREATTASLTLDQAIMRKDILLTSPYKLNRNVAKVYVYDKSLPESTAVKLWKLNDTPLVSTAAGLTVWGRFTYNGNECAGYGMIAPVDTTDFLMQGAGGGDKTSLWNVTTTYYGEVSKNVITADGALSNHTCVLLKNRGKPIVSDESTYKVYDHSGTAAERVLTIDSPFIQTLWQADFYDSFMDQLVATTLRFPIFQLEAQPAYQFEFDLFDKVNITIANYGINGAYLIGGIERNG